MKRITKKSPFSGKVLKISLALNLLFGAVILYAFRSEPEPPAVYTFIGDSNGTGGFPDLIGKLAGLPIKNESAGSNSFGNELTKKRPDGPKIVMLGTNFCKDSVSAILYIRTNPDAIYITAVDTKLSDSGLAETVKREAAKVGAKCIDLHKFTAGWGTDKSMLSDGIHFTKDGRNKAALFVSEQLFKN